MRKRSILSVVSSTSFFGVMLFLFSVVFPPFDDLAEVDLTIHMLQHVVIILAGATISYPLLKRGLIRPKAGWVPRFLLVVSAAAIVFWHIPFAWDAAVLNPLVHASEHFTFLLVGLAIGSFLQALSDSAKITALLSAFFGHMIFAFFLVAPFNIQVYPLFSLADQATLGWSLILTGWIFLVGVAYIVRKNPAWLQGYSGTSVKPAPSLPRNKPKWGGRAAATASIVMILVLGVYFSVTGAAVVYSRAPTQSGATVYIAETPVSWQFAPQTIVVVIGVNNTVTWVSHSTAYDTVSSDMGLFDSGLIQPGGTFSYTFTTQGTYAYHCAFHPWMTGSVIVRK